MCLSATHTTCPTIKLCGTLPRWLPLLAVHPVSPALQDLPAADSLCLCVDNQEWRWHDISQARIYTRLRWTAVSTMPQSNFSADYDHMPCVGCELQLMCVVRACTATQMSDKRHHKLACLPAPAARITELWTCQSARVQHFLLFCRCPCLNSSQHMPCTVAQTAPVHLFETLQPGVCSSCARQAWRVKRMKSLHEQSPAAS